MITFQGGLLLIIHMELLYYKQGNEAVRGTRKDLKETVKKDEKDCEEILLRLEKVDHVMY